MHFHWLVKNILIFPPHSQIKLKSFHHLVSASRMIMMRFNELIPTLILFSLFFFSGRGRWVGNQLSFHCRSTSHLEVKSQEIILELTKSK